MISDTQLGLFAALGAAMIWSVASIIFTAAGKEIRPGAINILRLFFALPLAGLTHWLQTGYLFPQASGPQLWALLASGVIGLGLGDLALFIAFDAVGPRLAMLVASTAPLLAAVLGWLFLQERLSALALVGMAVTLSGVGWVVLERSANQPAKKNLARGVFFGLLAAIGQAVGVLLSKQGMTHGAPLSPQAASLLRILAATVVMIPIQLWPTQKSSTQTTTRFPLRGLALIAVGAMMGTFIGMWLSLVAARYAPLGVAQTILSLPPVLILPLSYYVQKEHISPRAILGAIAAVAGTTFLFWS